MRRTLRALAALAGITLISTGCANVPAPTATGNAGNPPAPQAQAVKFAECMRANGVREFPDPDASGAFTIDAIANGGVVDPGTPAFKQASSACKDLEPPGFTGHKRSPQEQEQALKFAQCIRDNGVPDFPDPTVDGPLVNIEHGRSKPGLHAAMEKCRDIIADQLKGQ